MYFVNMKENLSEGTVLTRGRGSAIPYVATCLGEAVVGDMVVSDGKVQIGKGENVFGSGLSGVATDGYLTSLTKLTFKDIEDTEENPIILVLCNRIGLYKGVPAGLKFLYLGEDGVLAALIYGSCVFDGVPLQRCDTRDLGSVRVCKTIKGEDVKSLYTFLDKESGYNYLYDVVFQVHVEIKVNKFGEDFFVCKYVNSGEYWLTTEGIERQRKRSREILEKQKAVEVARKEKLKEQYDRTVKAREERIKAFEEAEARKKEEKLARREQKLKKDEVLVNVGAVDFLEAVRAAQGM